MSKLPKFFDSQAQAAAALDISVWELKEAKRSGAPGFRSGRVYPDELIPFLEKTRSRAQPSQIAGAGSDPACEKRRLALAAIVAVFKCANAGLVNDDHVFEVCRPLAVAAGEETLFVQTMFLAIVAKFAELSDAYAAHPRIVDYLCERSGVKYGAGPKKNARKRR